MKRLRRILIHCLIAISFLLFTTTIFFWVRSYWRADAIIHVTENGYTTGDGRLGVDSRLVLRGPTLYCARGHVGLHHVNLVMEGRAISIFAMGTNDPWCTIGWHRESNRPASFDPIQPTLENGFGFRFARTHTETELSLGEIRGPSTREPGMNWATSDELHAAIPCWFLAILTGVLPTRTLLRLCKRPPGFCPACGYDLRATPDRCPECGALPARANL